MKHLILLLTALCFFPLNAQASHGVGCDIRFTCMGGNTYQFELTFFRDCAGILPYVPTLNISGCGQTGTISMAQVGAPIVLPGICPGSSTCDVPVGSFPGVQQYTYRGTYTLPSACTDWTVTFSQCCRNAAVTNLTNTSNYRLYAEAHLDNSTVNCDNSPDFTASPVTYMCVGQPFTYNFGTIDPDGDEVTYALAQPLSETGLVIPFSGTFTTQQPMCSIPANSMVLNPQTGQLTITPCANQQAVLDVIATEWRIINGIRTQIGSVRRDIQVIVVNCGNNLVPVINAPRNIQPIGGYTAVNNSGVFRVCLGSLLTFQVQVSDTNAADVLTVQPMGIPTGATVTQTGTNPKIITFSWTPTAADLVQHNISYQATDNSCPVRGTANEGYTIIVQRVSATASSGYLCFGNRATQICANATGGTPPYTYTWNGGARTRCNTLPAGAYTVTIADAIGCTATAATSVTATPAVITSATATPATICQGASTNLNAAGIAGTYEVTNIPYAPITSAAFTTLVTSGVATPVPTIGNLDDGYWSGIPIGFTFSYFGTTYTNLAISTNGNVQFGTASLSTSFTPLAIPNTAAPNNIIAAAWMDIIFSTSGTLKYATIGTGTNHKFIVDWNGPVYDGADNATMQLIIDEATGAIESHFQQFTNNVPKTFVIGIENASGSTGFAAPGRNAVTVSTAANEAWRFTPSTLSFAWSNGATTANTSVTPSVTTIYTVIATNSTTGCTASSTVSVTVLPAPTVTISGNSTVCSNTTTQLCANVTGGATPYTYAWSGGATTNCSAVPAGTYTVTVTDTNGCTATESKVVENAIDTPIISAPATFCIGGSATLSTQAQTDAIYCWKNSNVTPAWELVGNAGFSTGQTTYSSLAFNGNTPYVAYTDYANGNKVTVMKFNGTAWETVGNAGFSAGQATYLSLAFYGSTPYVAYDDWANGYKSTVMKFNGTTWVAVGSPGFSNTNAQDLSLTFNGSTPYVAYEDYTSGTDIIVKKFDGTTWVTVGNTSAYANDGLHPSLVFYGSTPYIAYQNSNGKSAVIKFNGAAWELVGSAGFSAGQAFSESLAFGGSTPYVAYMDRANGDKCTVQKFNGTAWVTVGSAGFSAGGAQNPSLAVNDNTPYVAYRDGNNSYKITVMRFNGMAWETVGATSASTDGALYPSLAFNGNTPYVSYTDYANGGKTTLKRFSMCVSNSNSLLVNTSGTYTVEVTKNGCTATATKTITAIPCCTTQNGDFEMSTIIGASPDLDGGSSTAYWTRTTATSFYPQVITPGNGDNYAIRLRGCRRNTDPFSTVSGIQQGFNFIAGHYYTIRYSARRVNGAFPNPNSVPALQFRASNGALVSHRGGTPIGNAKNITSTSWLNYATGFVANSNFNTVSITAHAHSSAYHYVDIDKVCIADNGIPCPYPDISEVVSVNGLQFTVTNPTNTGANYNYTLQNTATAQIISAGSINQVAAGASTTVNIPNLQAATEYQLNVSPSCSTESIPITVTTANPDVTIADNTIAGCANATQADAFGSIVSNVLDVTGRTVATVIPDANTDLGTISIEMHNQNAPIAINNQVYLGRTFNVTSDQVSGLIPNGGGYTLRLYYLDRELPVGVQPQNLGITWWSGGATAECNMGSYANTPAVTSATLPNAQVADGEFGRNNNGFYLQFHANHFTMFGALIENISLPVKLLTFTGRKNDKYHHVQWTTATEQNSAFFVVQHSTNGIDFQDIGRVSAAGNSNTPSSYSFENAYFATGNNYYRLKMVDLDDAFEYSSTVTIRQDLAANGVHLYPNPTTGVLNIETDNPQQTIVIVNELGILVRTLTSVPPQIDLSELPSGVYMIRIGYQQFKIVKI